MPDDLNAVSDEELRELVTRLDPEILADPRGWSSAFLTVVKGCVLAERRAARLEGQAQEHVAQMSACRQRYIDQIAGTESAHSRADAAERRERALRTALARLRLRVPDRSESAQIADEALDATERK